MNLAALRRFLHSHSERQLPQGDRSFLFVPRVKPKGGVMLLHGFTASPWEMLELGCFLRRKGWLAFSPRLAGHGQGRQAFEQSGRADWLSSAEAAFKMMAMTGLQRLALIGHSMGGALAALLAASLLKTVSGLILGAPSFCLMDPKAPLSLLPPARLFWPVVRADIRHPDAAAHWVLEYASHRVAELVKLAWQARRAVLRLRQPLLLLQARSDPVVSCSYNQMLFPRIPSPCKRLVIYDAGEHNVFHRHNPRQAEVFRCIAEFLKSLAVG